MFKPTINRVSGRNLQCVHYNHCSNLCSFDEAFESWQTYNVTEVWYATVWPRSSCTTFWEIFCTLKASYLQNYKADEKTDCTIGMRMKNSIKRENKKFRFIGTLKGLFHPACLARAISWLAFVVAIFMGHENGDNKGQLTDGTCKACWMKQTL